MCLCVDVTHDDTETAEQLSSTSSSIVKCSPRWIVYPKTHSHGASRKWSANTQQRCLDACVDDTRCVAAEWAHDGKCWIHYERRQRRPFGGVTQFEIVRQCNPTIGRL